MNVKAQRWMRDGLAVALVLAYLAALYLPVYTDEVGWRFQLRAAIDGVDKMFSDVCGTNSLAVPPAFMWPARAYSAWFNLAFPDPLYVRLSGIGYALAWLAMLLVFIRRITDTTSARLTIGLFAIALLCMATLPLNMVMSRPEQPMLLAATAALLISTSAWRSDSLTPGRTAWLRSLAIVALAVFAMSYHVKSLFLLPLFAICIVFCAKGKPAIAPRAVAIIVMAGLFAASTAYWVGRLQCPDDPVLRSQYGYQNLGMDLTRAGSMQEFFGTVWLMLQHMTVIRYPMLTVPTPEPMSHWLAWYAVTPEAEVRWFLFTFFVWAVAAVAVLVALRGATVAAWRARRLDPRLVTALVILASMLGWSATQRWNNIYEAAFVLPLYILAMVMVLAAWREGKPMPPLMQRLASGMAIAGVSSMVMIAGTWGQSMAATASQHGYVVGQKHSVSTFNFSHARRDILVAAQKCAIPAPDKANALMIDDSTYFPFMQSRRPQHYLGVVGVWRGSITDPIGYLKSRKSDGIVMQCDHLPPALREKALSSGKYCCLGASQW